MKWFTVALIVFAAVLALVVGQGLRDNAGAVATSAAEFFNRLLLFCGGSIGLLVGALVAYLFRRQTLEARRMRDGAWPARDIALVGGWRRVACWLRGEAVPTCHYDPNLQVGPVLLTSSHGIYWPEPGGGWERQAGYAAQVEQTNRARATTPGDGVLAVPWARVGRRDRLSAPEARLLAGAYDKPPQTIDVMPTAPPVPPTPTPTLRGLLAASPKDGIAFGYSTEAPDVAIWYPANTAHLLVGGRTRGGKTQAGITQAAGALAKGWRVLVLAPRGRKDWRDMAQFGAEVADVTKPAQFVDALRVVEGEFTRREAILQEYQAPDLASVPFAARPARMVIFTEELGGHFINGTAAEREEMERILASLAAQSGADGIHIVAIDQAPEHYPRRFKANLAPVVFRLPQGPGMAAGYARAHALAPYQFHYDGDRWMSIYAAPQLAEALAGGGVIHEPLLGVRGSVREGVRERVPGGVPECSPEEGAYATNVPNAPNTRAEWYDWVLSYIADGHPELLQSPPSGVRAMARAMAAARGESDENSYVGRASEVAQQIRGELRVNGAPLGVDKTQEVGRD